MRATCLNCGPNSRSASARISAMTSRRISGGGIEMVCVVPLSSVSSQGNFVRSSAGRYHTTL